MMIKFYMISTAKNIIYSYLNNGEIKNVSSLNNFRKKMLPKIIESLIYSIFFMLFAWFFNEKFKPFDINSDFLQVFSGVLGFAITALAILLSSLDKVVSYMESNKSKFGLDAKVVIADITFPIGMILILMFANVIFFIFDSGYLKSFLSLFTFIYGLLLTFELVHTMFLIGMALIKEHLQTNNSNTSGHDDE